MKARGDWLRRRLPVIALGWALLGVGLASCGRAATPAEPRLGVGNAAATPGSATSHADAVEPAARYELGAGSVRIISSLQKPMRIELYATYGLPELDAFIRDLKAVLEEYQRLSQGKVQLRVIEPTTPELREQAKQAGIQTQAFGEVHVDQAPGDQSSLVEGFLGLAFHYGSERAAIPQLPHQDSSGLEFWITNKIRELRDKAEGTRRRIGVVTGKGELTLTDANLVPGPRVPGNSAPTLQGIMEQAFPFYRFEQVDLKGGSRPIDSELAGLIITQPKLDYSEPELRRLDEFLMLGDKTLLVYASAVNLAPHDPSLKASLSTHGLDLLLDGYGIHLNQDALFDHGSSFDYELMTPENTLRTVTHPGLVNVVYDAEKPEEEQRLAIGFAAFFRMDEVMFPFPSSLEIRRDRQPADVKLEVVARTTAQGSREQGKTIDMKLRPTWKPRPPLQSYPVAAYAQGALKSAFSEGSAAERAPRASRVLVIASSLFLTNPLAYAGNPPATGPGPGDPELMTLAQRYTKNLTATIIAFKNALDWMTGDDDLVALSAKLITPRRKPARPANPQSLP